MNLVSVKKIKGGKLTPDIKNKIDDVWKRAYEKPPRLMSERIAGEYRNNIFFLAMAGGRIMAVGNLKPVEIFLYEDSFKIFGIADIAARIKKQGYGKMIMREMLGFIKSRNITAIGFSEKKNRGFYLKCGYSVTDSLRGRFAYKRGSEGALKNSGEILYFERGDKLISRMLNHKNEIAVLGAPFW